MSIALEPLPYEPSALQPYMSQRTFSFHYDKHHRAYVDATNALVAGTPLEHAGLDAIISAARKNGDRRLFNSSAQAWNHAFFWHSMSPNGGGDPEGSLAKLAQREFGDFDRLKQALLAEATGHFGSGWTWLLARNGRLEIASYHDADTPADDRGVVPLLAIDVWEHAYYLDYQNARAEFVKVFLNKLVNWRHAARNLDQASTKAA